MKRNDLLNDIVRRAAGALSFSPANCFNLTADGVSEQFNLTRRALRDAYTFLGFGHTELSDDECKQYDGLFTWLAQALANDTQDLPQPFCLQQLLALTSLMDCDGRLWDKLCQAATSFPPPLIEDLRGIVRACRVNGISLSARFRYDADQIPGILAQAAARNWKGLQWIVQRNAYEFQSPLKQQAYAALARVHPASLRAFFENEHDFFEVNTYVLQAPAAESLRLAATVDNWTLRFWTVFHSAHMAAMGASSFPAEWKSLLKEAAGVPDEWARWQAVFNEYPGRYPQLQNVMGTMLADAPDEAIDTYVASLSDYEENRQHVAAALLTFSTEATPQRRQRLWSAAYRRWLLWDFGRTDYSSHVSGVKQSAFDFPLIGYIVECLDDTARATWQHELRQRAAALEKDWHADLAVPVSERFKIISTYQLLAHAEQVIAGAEDWLTATALYCPDWEDRTHYRSLRYDQAFGTNPLYPPAIMADASG
ncbi:hypothetical protein [Duganella vulcania]|uniref:Uncharacterized protein n=1 Tax=Duganella vulcania TaxID=2692166 RepID=A0A845GS82_9BURK|nr:hypothetical protein [Duganella vulcania]MYM96068.1 hypothetical protein [Duganella vulcania]